MSLNFPKCSSTMEPLCLLHSLPSHTHTLKVIVSHGAPRPCSCGKDTSSINVNFLISYPTRPCCDPNRKVKDESKKTLTSEKMQTISGSRLLSFSMWYNGAKWQTIQATWDAKSNGCAINRPHNQEHHVTHLYQNYRIFFSEWCISFLI